MASPISWHGTLALSLGLLLAGCASVAPERAFEASAAAAQARMGVDARLLRSDADRQALQAEIDTLLQAPLTQDAAVPDTRYQPAYMPPARAAATTTPDRAWQEHNRIVAAQPGHDAHASHGKPAPDPHAHHHTPAPAQPDHKEHH